MDPAPTAEVDRTNDQIYSLTLGVVKAVTTLSTIIKEMKSHLYVDQVKEIGGALRKLLAEADVLMEKIPEVANRGVSHIAAIAE